jgi:hypothetical protein
MKTEIKNMTKADKLRVLEDQFKSMISYKLLCNSTGSLLDYSSEDFERESYLIKKIKETKDTLSIEFNG